MARTMTKGTCSICHGVFGKAAMTRHLASCMQNVGDKSMRFRVGKVLSPGMQFLYEYDFGTTTELRLKVIAERAGKIKKGASAVKILARNEQPAIACDVCGKPATNICSECVYDEGGWLCEECAETHECGEEMLLPVVNSPRVGMCGYTG